MKHPLRSFGLVALLSLVASAQALAQAAQAPAAAPAAAAEAGPSFLKIIYSGGVMMYPLALLSVVAVVMILLFMLTIRRNAVVSDRFMDTAEAMIRKRDYLGLIAYCHRHNQSMARITMKALDFATKNPGTAFSEVREVAQAEGSRQASILNQRITYLADVGSIAPMVGLLGTVIGMIKSFMQISRGNFEGVHQIQLSSGVSEALITTASGLIIGIPALIFYSFFRGRVQLYVAEMEAAATHLLAMLAAQLQRTSGQRAQSESRRQDDYATPLRDERVDLEGI
jgi:biopolymer transport protein ExbB